jgi:molybdate transport system permease protein
MAELLHLSADEATAVRLSLRIALWAMTASLIPGILVALVLARGRFWGKSFVDGLVHLPLVMPPVVTGYLLLLLLGRRGPLGQFLDEHFGIVFAFRRSRLHLSPWSYFRGPLLGGFWSRLKPSVSAVQCRV